jgi:hypothetical protein
MTMSSTLPAARLSVGKLADLAIRWFGMIPHSLIAHYARGCHTHPASASVSAAA